MWVPLWLCGFHYGSVGSIVGLWSHCALCSHSVFGVLQCIWGPIVLCVPIVCLGPHSGFGVPQCVWGPAVPCVPIVCLGSGCAVFPQQVWGPAVCLGSRGVFGARLCRVAGAAPIAVSP